MVKIIGNITETNSIRLVPTDTLPTSVEGSMYFDLSENTLKFHNGTSFVAVSALSFPMTVSQGGTGISVTNPYSILCGGTTSTGSLQSLTSVGTAGQVLTSNGASVLPSWQTVSSGTTTFSGLTDTPANFTGSSLKFARVNAGETALEFANLSSTSATSTVLFSDLNGVSEFTILSLPSKAVITDMHLDVGTAFDSGTGIKIGTDTNRTKFFGIETIDTTGLKSEPHTVNNEMLSTSIGTNIKIYNTSSTWTAGGNLITARNQLGSAGTQTAGLSIGGNGGNTLTEEYDGTTWTAGGNLIVGKDQTGGTGTQTAALNIGGLNGGVSINNTEEYDGTTWTAGGNLITAKRDSGEAGTQTAGLAFGGTTGTLTNITEEYNGTSWSSGGNMITARRDLAGCGTQTAGLGFGGETYSVLTEEYNGTSWSSGGNLNTGRQGLGGAGTQTAGLSFGGLSTGAVYSVVTEEYDGATWTGVNNLLTGRFGLGGTGTQTAALNFGGGIPALSAITEEYSIANWSGLTTGSLTLYYNYVNY